LILEYQNTRPDPATTTTPPLSKVLITGGKVEWRTNKKGRAVSDPALVPRAIE